VRRSRTPEPAPRTLAGYTREALRVGMRRGLGEGNRLWFAIGVVAGGIRLFQWMARPTPSFLTEVLEPGESIIISHLTED